MSYAILVLALAELGLLIWATRCWIKAPSNIGLLLVLFIILPVCLDASTVALGGRIGFGPVLETMNRMRFTWFVFSMPLMFAICASILATADFKWAQHRWLVPALIAVAVVLGGYEAVQAWQQDFHPACMFDIKRYVFQVQAGQECNGSQAGDGTFGLPLVIPLATLGVVLTGIVLWWKRRWPWLALVCIAQVGVLAIPKSDYSVFFSYPFDGLLTATMAITAVRFFGVGRLS
jgi:hypothetical protein